MIEPADPEPPARGHRLSAGLRRRRPRAGRHRPAGHGPARIIVLEPLHEGHRMSYCAALVRYATEAGLEVAMATSREALESEEFRLHMGHGALGDVPLIDVGSLESIDGPGYPYRLVRLVAKVQALDPEAEIIILEGDKFVLAAALSGGVDWRRVRLLVMRAPRLTPRLRTLAVHAPKLLAMVVISLRGATVRVLAPATAARDQYRYGPWQATPDPVEVAADEASLPPEMRLLGSGADRRWIGVFGHIARRKNLDLVVEAARLCGAPTMGVVVGGKVMPDELERCAGALDRFQREGGAVVLLDRLLTDVELDSCIQAVDVIVLAHSSEGPSGILGKAAALGTFVVSAGALSLRRDTAALGAGAWTPLAAGPIAAALASSASGAGSPVKMADSVEFARALLGTCPSWLETRRART